MTRKKEVVTKTVKPTVQTFESKDAKNKAIAALEADIQKTVDALAPLDAKVHTAIVALFNQINQEGLFEHKGKAINNLSVGLSKLMAQSKPLVDERTSLRKQLALVKAAEVAA